jgi:hypothetical protein
MDQLVKNQWVAFKSQSQLTFYGLCGWLSRLPLSFVANSRHSSNSAGLGRLNQSGGRLLDVGADQA